MNGSSYVIAGLKGSGKTTFLAALWHLIEAGEVATELVLNRIEGDVTYLNEIAAAWRSFQKVPRTSQTGNQRVAIHVRRPSEASESVLSFPDLAGEGFDRQVENRLCREEYVADFDQDGGILLVVTVNKGQDDLSIVEVNSSLPPDAVGESEAPVGKVSDAIVKEGKELPEWLPSMVPAQVRLVQILTDLLNPPFRRGRRRVAVMLTAWDLVADSQPSPRDWLQSEMPLLDQFIKHNAEHFAVRIYGVSAQGLDLKSGDLKAAAKLPASERIMVVGENASQHDLTAPIVWLMTGN